MAQTKEFRPIEEYPPVLQARHVKEILGISEAKAYEVLNSQKCPTIPHGQAHGGDPGQLPLWVFPGVRRADKTRRRGAQRRIHRTGFAVGKA